MKNKERTIGIIAAVILVFIIALAISNDTFSVLGEEADNIHITDADGNRILVKYTLDVECESKQECLNYISSRVTQQELDDVSDYVSCDNKCVVDYR